MAGRAKQAGRGYVAFDLGAESGRAMLARVEVSGRAGRIELEEVHRFANVMQRLPDGYHWSLVALWGRLVEGLRRAGQRARERDLPLVSLGVDTWGVDYGLIGKSGQLLGLPYAYRDDANHAAMAKTLRKLTARRIYDTTGIQFMFFNTLFQLVAQRDRDKGLLQLAKRLLFTPDLLHYFFTGRMVNEATIASTSQLVNPRTGRWSRRLLNAAGVPAHFLGPIVPAGTKIGRLAAAVAEEAGVEPIEVIAPGSHDTASAVAAVPVDDVHARRGDWLYLSSGTWSLMGAELDEPMISDASREAGFTNERGVANKIRFLKNIAGLWLVQETRREFARRGQEYDYETLTRLAGEAEPFRTLIDPAHGPFGSPGAPGMPAKIAAFARATGQPEPRSVGAFVRCCLESLAMSYRHTLESLQSLLGRSIAVLHVVGGGGRNGLLNQMTADAIGRDVIVGPYEATAVGNALTQAIGARQVKDLGHLRAIVRESFDPQRFTPRDPDAFDRQYDRFVSLLGR